jgi:hypothetical protein
MHKGGSDSEDIIMTRIHGEDTIAILGEGMRSKLRGGNDNEGTTRRRRTDTGTSPFYEYLLPLVTQYGVGRRGHAPAQRALQRAPNTTGEDAKASSGNLRSSSSWRNGRQGSRGRGRITSIIMPSERSRLKVCNPDYQDDAQQQGRCAIRKMDAQEESQGETRITHTCGRPSWPTSPPTTNPAQPAPDSAPWPARDGGRSASGGPPLPLPPSSPAVPAVLGSFTSCSTLKSVAPGPGRWSAVSGSGFRAGRETTHQS